MEAIKDFFSELKERVSSPLFGSFIISWLIFNWRIPITLIFYKQADLSLDHHTSFVDAIYSYWSWYGLFWPIGVSLFYTFAYPYIRNQIKLFHANRNIELDTAILKKSAEKGFVSVARHQAIEKELHEKVLQLTDYYTNQTQISEENRALKLSYSELELKFSESISNKEDLKRQIVGLEKENREFKKQVARLSDPYVNLNQFFLKSYKVSFSRIIGLPGVITAIIDFKRDVLTIRYVNAGIEDPSFQIVPPPGEYELIHALPGQSGEISFSILGSSLNGYFSFFLDRKPKKDVFIGKLDGEIPVEFSVIN